MGVETTDNTSVDQAQRSAGAVYPPRDADRAIAGEVFEGARIAQVEIDSPAYDAGFEPGCRITHVNGQALRDLIDWRWLSADDVIELSYIDLDGDCGTVELEREPFEDWGLTFDGVVFDGIRLCRNACTFCFMRQLPTGLRPQLSLRDDDYRLSFLSGTFVTLTNLTLEDEQRIAEQRISPLRVSLHAYDAQVRQQLMGKHAAHGLQALEHLLQAGVQVHAQIVLVPEVNDGEVLKETLTWAYAHPGIVEVGIVPLGYTRFQTMFDHSFNNPAAAQQVLDLIAPFQETSRGERGHAWVFAADEFYRNAYGQRVLEEIPPASHYGDFGMFEDGVGIIRSYIDDWEQAQREGLADQCAQALAASGRQVHLMVGGAMQPFLDRMIAESPLAGVLVARTVQNAFFGGNVDVTGLLTGQDIAQSLEQLPQSVRARDMFIVPNVVLNDNNVLLDDDTLQAVGARCGCTVHPVSCNPRGFLAEIIALCA